MPLRQSLEPTGVDVESSVASLNYAVNNGATISSNSWANDGFSQEMYDAIREAGNQNHLFIAAAGGARDNDIDDPTNTTHYPNSYNLDNIISVAMVTRQETLHSFSSFGLETVDLAAPSPEIWRICGDPNHYNPNPPPGWGAGPLYHSGGGTSSAAAQVSGVAALLRTLHPDWTNDQIKTRILSTVDPLPALEGIMVTGGRLNAARALGATPNGIVELDGFGATYMQDFDGLGSASRSTGTALPFGWSINNAGTINALTTVGMPTASVPTGTYNAGIHGDPDRTLATGNTDREAANAIYLTASLLGNNDVRAVVLENRIEAWHGDLINPPDDPGEAAFVISIQFDPERDGTFSTAHTFNGGAPVTTGLTLAPGALDGNGAAGVSFASGLVELPTAIPAGSDFRLNFDAQGVGQTQGYIFGVDDFLFRIVAPGDTDGNGELDVLDVAAIIDANKFNNPAAGAASWAEGDFNGDDLVNSTDLFLALATGKYKQGPYTTATPPAALATVPEPSTFVLAALGLLALLTVARRFRHANHP